MKIGIIVHSKTGHTYSVAVRIKEKLTSVGHTAVIEKLIPVNEVHPRAKNIQLEKNPDLSKYDALVFGAPVWAFTVSPVLKSFLLDLSSLQNKKIICFVTMGFPYSWLGGGNAISWFKKITNLKNGVICGTWIINWSNSNRENKIADIVEKSAELL
jgi:flavodoxin